MKSGNDTARFVAGAAGAAIRFVPEMFPTDGFCGVHDDPMARILVLRCELQIAIVTLELVMLPPDGIDAVKEAVHKITGTDYENIWVHTTHAITTPHAPHAPMGMGGVPLEISQEEKETLDQKLARYRSALMDAITQAAEGAMQTLRPARMGIGCGSCNVNGNRDRKTALGWWIGFDPEGVSNHTATVLRFEEMSGQLIAGLISYGLKPCAIDNSEMDQGTRLVSSDVSGYACRLLEERLGAPVLFAMSAAGDQVPLRQAWYDEVEADGSIRKVDLGVQEGLKIVEALGQQMAEEIAPIIDRAVCTDADPDMITGKGSIQWPGKARTVVMPVAEAVYTEEGMQTVDVLGIAMGDVALVGLKPEMNTVTEYQLQAASPYEHTLVVSMVNGGQKYMPDRGAYENSTWEAQSSPLMPGAAERWVEEAVAMLERMKGNEGSEE